MSIKERTHDRVWEAYYGELGSELMRDTQQRVNWVCGQVDGRKVLDIGCSQGIAPILLAREGRTVIGIDSDPKAIDEANQHLAEEAATVQQRVTFINGDFLAIDTLKGELVDTVVIAEVLEHLVRPADFIEAAAQYLKPGGRIVITVPFGIYDFIDHKSTFYLTEPYLLLDRHFEVSSVKMLGRWIGFTGTKRAAPCLSGRDRTWTTSDVVGLEHAIQHIERGIRDEVANERRKIIDFTAKQKTANEVVSRLTKDIDTQIVRASGLDKELKQIREEFTRRVGILEKREVHLTDELSARDSTVHDLACQLLETHAILNTQKSSSSQNEIQLNQQFESERQLARQRESQLSTDLCVAREQVEQAHSALEALRIERTKEGATFFNREQILQRELGQARFIATTLEGRLAELAEELEKLQIQSTRQQAELARSQDVARAQAKERSALERRIAELAEELKKLQIEFAQQQAELAQSQDVSRAQAQERSALEGRITELTEELEKLEIQSARQQAELAQSHDVSRAQAQERSALEVRLDQMNQELNAARVLEKAVAGNFAALQCELVDLKSNKESLENQVTLLSIQQTKLQRQFEVRSVRLAAQERRSDMAVAQTEHLKNTLSFRLGNALIFAGKSWRNAVSLPKTLWQIRSDGARRRQDKLAERVLSVQSTPSSGITEIKASGLLSAMTVQPTEVNFKKKLKSESTLEKSDVSTKDDKLQSSNLIGSKGIPGLKKKLCVAAVMDEFTFQCFAPECDLHQITPQNWRHELEQLKPELLFIESAWRGLNDLWKNKITPASPEIMSVIEWCIENHVPTVFWNKEDPFSFDKFLVLARMVDCVFTTDINSISAYRRELGHDRVYVLPFAAQPRLHNPIEIYERQDAASFAGSYYWKYKERMKDFDAVMSAVMRIKMVTIYDRNHSRLRPNDFEFPENYRKFIVGSLPYTEIDKAYKGFLYAINMNTSKSSPTMFARRVFELAASNTVTISNYSEGVRLFFGDLVICSDNDKQIEYQIAALAANPNRYRKVRLWALRKVLSEHTYRHRLNYVLSKVSKTNIIEQPTLSVCAVGRYADAIQFNTLCLVHRRQKYQATLVLIGPSFNNVDLPSNVFRFDEMADAQQQILLHTHVAVLSPHDHYGEHYIEDLALATSFSDAEVVGKVARYEIGDAGFLLMGDGMQYHHTNAINARAALARLSEARIIELMLTDFEVLVWRGFEFLSLDEFSYCREGVLGLTSDQLDCIDKTPVANEGANFSGEILRDSARQEVGVIETWGLPVEPWSSLLPPSFPNNVFLSMNGEVVHVKTTLGQDVFRYVYLQKSFTPSELRLNKPLRCRFKGDGEGDVRLAFVFDDANGKKISHVMMAANTSGRVELPAKCTSIRIGLRFCGPVNMRLHEIELTDATITRGLLPRHKTLLCVSAYPSYDDLYRYAFVHSRVISYKNAGFPVDVMKVGVCLTPYNREFGGIDIIEGHADTLKAALSLGHYDHLILHSLNAQIWAAIRSKLGSIRITVWSHGADIQPWYRRAMLFDSDNKRIAARRVTTERAMIWRELLQENPDKTRVVFVSKFQASEALCDLGITPKAMVCVVPNPIDTGIFQYQRKTPELRFKVLSIRPFANRIYANDLTVRSILLLSQRSGFEKLQFTIAGDGPLFDETVQPIRHFENVRLIKRFLQQAEIAELHAEHGIFLCPSRMDTHGVSRDEAMASGLVPVTSRVAAIPEFVDVSCGFMAEPEDAQGLADAIECLVLDPECFMAMSKAASERVHQSTAAKHIIGRELAILGAKPVCSQVPEIVGVGGQYRIAIYGDVNLNIMDGSAVWAASLAETLACIPGVMVTLFLKAPIKRLHILEPLINLSGRVRLVEPNIVEDKGLSINSAIQVISEAHLAQPFDSIVLRGFDLCTSATQQTWANLIWAYITDIPQTSMEMTDEKHARIDEIIYKSGRMLCQTRAFEEYVSKYFPSAKNKTLILPPMIPLTSSISEKRSDGPLRIVYAGKFAPLWGVREMFRSFGILRQSVPDAELHVFGDKFHNPKDDLNFQSDIKRALTTQNGVYWHGAVGRNELLSEIKKMDVAWAYRHASLEASTHELSTKLLEYAAAGVPVIVARNHVNEELLGADYPLFVNTEDEANSMLELIAQNPHLGERAVLILMNAAQRYTFTAVADFLVLQGLFERVNSSQRLVGYSEIQEKLVEGSDAILA